MRVFVLVENANDFLDDRRVDVPLPGEVEHTARGPHAFGDAVHFRQDVGELAAAAELQADPAIATVRADAGGDEVAEAGEAVEGVRAGAQGNAEAGNFNQAAGHQGLSRCRRLHKCGAGASHHVLSAGAQCQKIGVGIDAKSGRRKPLHRRASKRRRGWQQLRSLAFLSGFFGVARSDARKWRIVEQVANDSAQQPRASAPSSTAY